MELMLWESINRLVSFLVVFINENVKLNFFSKLLRYIICFLLLNTETLKAF